MKSFRQYLAALDRLATAQPHQIGRKKLYRAIFASTFVVGSQFLGVISATAVPTPATPSPLLPTRILLNGSFEAPAQSADGAGYGINEAYNNTPAIIWRTTEPGNSSGTYRDQLELWRGIRTGNGGYDGMAPAYPGDSENKQYAEINASTNASIYQDLCIMPSENVGWSLSHAVRKNGTFASGNPTNIMQVSITDPAGWANSKTPPVAQANAYYSSLGDYSSSGTYPGTKATSTASITSAKPFVATTYNDGWKAYSGSWTSTNTSPKLLRFAFGAIQGSNSLSYGNFIDNVQLSLPALIDFLPPDPGTNVNVATTTEGNPNTTNPPYYYLSVRINGATAAGQVTIALNGLNQSRSFRLGTVKKGTATVTGLSATVDDNSIKLNIPAGTYNPNLPSDYIHIPIDFSDTRTQPTDNLLFTLQSVNSGSLTIKSTQCTTDRITVETRLIDDDFQKRVELPVALPFKIAAH
jgi:hypothetical protein